MKDFRIKQFSRFTQKYSLKKKKVIEIGCGDGEYLFLLKQFGVDAYGLEYSDNSVNRCLKKNMKVENGFIESSTHRLNNSPFDAFFILNFLEHLPFPNSTLGGIHNNIKDGAVGLVEVPNFDMILRNNLFSEFINDHLLYFTKETLNKALVRNGFKVIEFKEIWYDYIISAVVEKIKPTTDSTLKDKVEKYRAKKLDLSCFLKHQSQLKKEIEEYIGRFKDKRVAIWGAGHQSLAVISLINLAGKIKYVVDSATFKQGKYTPVTHIPIVSPGTLNAEPVDGIIIIAAGYSDEIAKIIRHRFDRNLNVTILRDFGLEAA